MRRDNGLSPEFFLCDATLLTSQAWRRGGVDCCGGGGITIIIAKCKRRNIPDLAKRMPDLLLYCTLYNIRCVQYCIESILGKLSE